MDVGPALQVPGVHAVYAYEDIVKLGGKNEFGPTIEDEVVFLPPGSKIQSIGQVLGVVVAETLESAELGSRSCKVEYGSSTEKAIMSIEEAIAAKSFYEIGIHDLARGDQSVVDGLAEAPDTTGEPKIGDVVRVSGSFRCGNQEHFYLETQSTLVVPSDAATDLTIYCSTQAASKTQKFSASATGTPASKVVVRVKRLGGGFGGKETRTLFSSLAAAVAAKIACRPVRLTLGRDEDMKLTGNRHAFLSHYRASARMTDSGPKLVAIDVTMYSNSGFALDLSIPVMDRALFHVDGCYFFPNFRAKASNSLLVDLSVLTSPLTASSSYDCVP
jgi:xanthine dehydrogenase/oxidase